MLEGAVGRPPSQGAVVRFEVGKNPRPAVVEARFGKVIFIDEQGACILRMRQSPGLAPAT